MKIHTMKADVIELDTIIVTGTQRKEAPDEKDIAKEAAVLKERDIVGRMIMGTSTNTKSRSQREIENAILLEKKKHRITP